MTEINTFCASVLVIASLMTAIHYAVKWMMDVARKMEPETVIMLPSDDGAYLVTASAAKVHGDWVETARAAARKVAQERGEVSSDDIWDIAPPPANVDARVLGAVFRPSSEWVKIGHKPSVRRECHNREVSVWRLREAA